MRNKNFLKGKAVNLRLVNLNDAEFIVKLRTNKKLNRYIHNEPTNVNIQISWIKEYLERDNDYYFIIEKANDKSSVGLISIYNIQDKSAEWGRWILSAGNNFAIESVQLIYKFAFELLELDYIFCRTVEANKSVISFHNSCGLKQVDMIKNHFFLNQKYYHAVEHRLYKENWKKVDNKLEKLAYLIYKKTNV